MKEYLKFIVFNLICVLIFSILYFLYKKNFTNYHKVNIEFIDCFFLSITTQAGVGLTSLSPIDNSSKILLIIQQIIMLCGHLFALYVFTL